MSPLIISIIAIAAFLIVIFHSLHIAFSFALVGFIGLIFVRDLNTAFFTIGNTPLTWASAEALIPFPLFILMGFFAYNSGISSDLYDTARKWIGRLPGGLSMATTLACTGFAACSGSSVAAAATMGTVAYPEMEQYKYDRRLSTGCIAAGGLLAPLIPPSSTFIVMGVLTQTSIVDLFMAGIFPGLLLSGLFLIAIFVVCRRNPNLAPGGPSFSWRDRLISLRGVWGMLALFILVIGGLYVGIFTPSEAGAIGAFGAFVIGLLKRRLTLSNTLSSLKDAARVTCFLFTIFIGAMIFNSLLAVSGFSTMFKEWVTAFPVPPAVIVIGTLFIYLPLGMVMDAMAICLLTLPIVFPIIVSLGYDLVWYLVMAALAGETALLSPPVGLNVYVVHGVTKVPLGQVFRGIYPFLIMVILCMVILFIFPEISLFIPSVMQ